MFVCKWEASFGSCYFMTEKLWFRISCFLVVQLNKLDAKGSLLFDIVATRKYIGTYIPQRLGM